MQKVEIGIYGPLKNADFRGPKSEVNAFDFSLTSTFRGVIFGHVLEISFIALLNTVDIGFVSLSI